MERAMLWPEWSCRHPEYLPAGHVPADQSRQHQCCDVFLADYDLADVFLKLGEYARSVRQRNVRGFSRFFP